MNQTHLIYYMYVTDPGNWIGTVKGQIEDLIYSSLLKSCHLYLCLSGDPNAMNNAKILIDGLLYGVTTMSVDYFFEEKNQYEYPGIHRLYTLAQDNPTDIFFYMHSKGVSYSKFPIERYNINIYLTRLTLWNHSKALSVFDNNKNVNKIGLFPSAAGWMWFNFFWVRGSYLASCRKPGITSNRHYYESWLGKSGKTGISDCYSLHNDKISADFNAFECGEALHRLYRRYRFMVINQKICQAYYGIKDHFIDITKKINTILDKNNIIIVNNLLVEEDPCPGAAKLLILNLEHEQTFVFREYEIIFFQFLARQSALPRFN